MKPGCLIACLAFLLLPLTGRAWDAGGHLVVAEIARRHLRPEVAARLAPLPPLLDARANEGRPYDFVSAAPWLDQIKAFPREYRWSARHFVNLECSKPFPVTPPEGENAYTALREAMKTLRDAKAAPKARAQALAQVIHIVGDIHQPLHTASRHDRGGNGYLIVPPFQLPSRRGSTRPYNLHRFWDSAYRFTGRDGEIREILPPSQASRPPKTPGDPDNAITRLASMLLRAYPRESFPEFDPAKPDAFWQWIGQSHALALEHGWPPGPPPKTYEVGRLRPEFVQASHETADRQLVLAGLRLAALLNTLEP